MYLTRSEYDRGVNTFSPEGRLFQVSLNRLLEQDPVHLIDCAKNDTTDDSDPGILILFSAHKRCTFDLFA